ncbi:hypothetical protein B0H14DRAFT_2644141 [Mycena olivaceomarginata]|nr:hypothetical protein B0H14DRAFT_2644141 [Mycena olivaceomarginata]
MQRSTNRNRRGTTRSSGPPTASSSVVHTFSVSVHDLLTPAEAAPISSYVDRVSANGKAIVREAVRVNPPLPLKRTRRGDHTPAVDDGLQMGVEGGDEDQDRYVMTRHENTGEDDPPVPPLPQVPNSKRFQPADKALDKWMRLLWDIFLDQLLRRDGRADASSSVCPACNKRPAEYRCQECAGGLLLCKECCVGTDAENPLHVIFKWTGLFFMKTSLQKLGLRIQLRRPTRQWYPHRRRGFSAPATQAREPNPTSSCCVGVGTRPPTTDRKTAATFLVLDKFHLHMLQVKTTAYDFYAVLERLTNNTGIKPPDRYQVFMRMAQEYRHLLMLKRAGRGHNPSGVWGTAAGELAVECPVCPNPNVNLPEGWENAPPEDMFLYVLFIALDACFRLKRRMISSEFKDPGLGTGWAYVMENTPYRHFLLGVTEQKEMSTCSGLAALDYANTKFSRGYSTTGVGMGVCVRHEFVQANGVGDLQKGERFANMDYIFGSILRHKDPRLWKIISYDIVCQWWKYLLERMQKLPPLVRMTLILAMFRFVIPKMHIHAHTLECQVKFSLNLVPGSGQTDGEGIEHPWASIGAIATSTRVSGPGARHDSLDDHWSFWNWLKTTGLPSILRQRLDTARKEQASQREAFEAFSLQQADRGTGMEENGQGMTESEVRLKFATEEEEEAKNGVPALHEVTPSSFVTAGLELEGQQRRVRVQAELKKAGTTAMVINMKSLRSKLNRGIDRFGNYKQRTPRPRSRLWRSAWHLRTSWAEDVPLMLPSALTPAEREGGGCAKGLLEIEDSLRAAQCRAALPRLRNQLHIKSRFLLYKRLHSRHQGMNTRSRTLIARNESKIRLHSEKFQMAWQARLRIANGDKSKVGWPQLKKEDICCMQDAEERSRNAEKRRKASERLRRKEDELREDGLLPALEEDKDDEMVTRGGENFREISWIWTVAGTAGTDEELEDALRIEWSKAWARSRHWTEEVRLLEEEWRRLPVTYTHCEQLWLQRAVAVPTGSIPEAVAEGKVVYAAKQAQLYRDLAARAEVTRTEVKLARGKKRQVWAPSWDPVVSMEDNVGAEADDTWDREDDGEEDDERGGY